VTVTVLETVEIQTGRNPKGTVIWLHGLGADAHDFEPIVPQLVGPDERPLRFIFPNAPVRPISINGGMSMRAWHDILAFDRRAPQDEVGIRASDAAVGALIRRENERGIASNRIVLGGFSQGGAISLFTGPRYPEQLAGIMGLSCYMLLEDSLPAERTVANYKTPVFLAHGSQDPMVDIRRGQEARQLLEAGGYPVEWHAYAMPHSVCPQEVDDIGRWLRRVL
jgi:phospholipase/carboxylesterase